jgi:GNAT superfamily N-acetyltransferase
MHKLPEEVGPRVANSGVSAEARRDEALKAPAPFDVRLHPGGALPPELLELRRRTFVEERGFLDANDVISGNDAHGVHVCIYDTHGTLVAATHMMRAADSDFAEHSRIPRAKLQHAALSSRSHVHPEWRERGVFALLVYGAMRWARMQGLTTALGYVEEGNPPIKDLLQCREIPAVPSRRYRGVGGREYALVAVHADVNYCLHRTFTKLPRALRRFVAERFFGAELAQHVETGMARFFRNPWFARVFAGTLTLDEYAYALANLHQYVRWTTRLLATITGVTPDARMRKHFLTHLSEEVDHERLLERDLRTLGWDVDYVADQMSPEPNILAFMSVQQSLAGFERDPLLFLASPLIAEGLSAKLDEGFFAALDACLERCGIEHPRAATTFLRSHTGFDGGDDGHWSAVREAMAERIEDEKTLQRVFALTTLIIDSMDRAYQSYVDAALHLDRSASTTDHRAGAVAKERGARSAEGPA